MSGISPESMLIGSFMRGGLSRLRRLFLSALLIKSHPESFASAQRSGPLLTDEDPREGCGSQVVADQSLFITVFDE